MLPRVLKTVKVSPFDFGVGNDRKLLIEVGERSFIVSPALGALAAALRESGELDHIRGELGSALGRRPCNDEICHAISQLPRSLFIAENESPATSDWLFLIRRPLLQESYTNHLAGGLKWLFDPWIVSFVGCASAALFAFVLAHYSLQDITSSDSALASVLVVILLIACAFAHELGHAAACARFGVQPGHIGFGLYAVFPVLYVDVSRAWRLSAKQRAAVDVGGIYMQCILVTLLSPFLLNAVARPHVAIIITCNFYWILYNLNPVFKTDGYWLIADLAGVPNLRQRTLRFFVETLHSNGRPETISDSRSKIIYFIYGALVLSYVVGFALSVPVLCSRYILPRFAAAIADWSESAELFRSANLKEALERAFGASVQTAVAVVPVILIVLLAIRGCIAFIHHITKIREGQAR
jgi:putative peptide zinc metalloprotease protein